MTRNALNPCTTSAYIITYTPSSSQQSPNLGHDFVTGLGWIEGMSASINASASHMYGMVVQHEPARRLQAGARERVA